MGKYLVLVCTLSFHPLNKVFVTQNGKIMMRSVQLMQFSPAPPPPSAPCPLLQRERCCLVIDRWAGSLDFLLTSLTPEVRSGLLLGKRGEFQLSLGLQDTLPAEKSRNGPDCFTHITTGGGQTPDFPQAT
jgi:hypothetical protein